MRQQHKAVGYSHSVAAVKEEHRFVGASASRQGIERRQYASTGRLLFGEQGYLVRRIAATRRVAERLCYCMGIGGAGQRVERRETPVGIRANNKSVAKGKRHEQCLINRRRA